MTATGWRISTLNYQIVVTNNGPSDVTAATVEDVLPAELTGCTWTCAPMGGASCTAAGTGGIDEEVDLPVGSSVRFDLSCTFPPRGTPRSHLTRYHSLRLATEHGSGAGVDRGCQLPRCTGPVSSIRYTLSQVSTFAPESYVNVAWTALSTQKVKEIEPFFVA